jgi:hypothetical protein
VSEILLRVEMRDPVQAHQAIAAQLWPFVKAHTTASRPMVCEVRPWEDVLTEEQRAYYHGVVLTEIAAHCRPNGVQYPMQVWKEWFREKFLSYKVRTSVDPFTGKRTRKRVRVSSEDLGVKGYGELIEKVIAFAATDLDYTVSEPLPAHLRPEKKRRERIDPATGEITNRQAVPA